MQNTYLQWVIENTATIWWHDSAEAAELDLGLARGAVGVTTNPYLANLALHKDRLLWAPAIQEVFAQKLPPEAKAEALTRIAVTRTAEKLLAELSAVGPPGPMRCMVLPGAFISSAQRGEIYRYRGTRRAATRITILERRVESPRRGKGQGEVLANDASGAMDTCPFCRYIFGCLHRYYHILGQQH